jgi:hypothetical protein
MYNSSSAWSVRPAPYFRFGVIGNAPALSISKIDNARYPCQQNAYTIQTQFPDPNQDNNTVDTLPQFPNPPTSNTSTGKSLALLSSEFPPGTPSGSTEDEVEQNEWNLLQEAFTKFPTSHRTNKTNENKKVLMSNSPIPSKPPTQANLLPVTDFRFNVREICKQSVLLEDHLTHPSKRCMDCCVKHFLTMEALAEEMLTLDNDHQIASDEKWSTLLTMPDDIRSLQYTFVKHIRDGTLQPEHIHYIVQELRRHRKKFMIISFDIVFPSSSSSPSSSCQSNKCALKI